MTTDPVYCPNLEDLKGLFSMLTGDGTKVEKVAAWDFKQLKDCFLATYIDDEDKICAYGVIDLPAAASVSAIMTKVPVARVNEILKTGQLDELLSENLKEVLNICAALLNKDGFRHMRVLDTKAALPLPEEFTALMAATPARIDVKLTVANYGNGKFSMITKK